jgi:dephospho-CoA kinase
MTFILGLTGSIGMGKSTTAGLFRALGCPVHDSDAVVHALYRGEAVEAVEAAFPGVAVNGEIDRTRLSAAVLGDPAALKRLEAVVHPFVRRHEAAFRSRAAAGRRPVAVLDVPLLFETGGERRCDAVLVVTAPEAVQRARVLARPGMTPERLDAILARQTPDVEKRRRAHFLVDTSQGLDCARAQVGAILRALAGRFGMGGER